MEKATSSVDASMRRKMSNAHNKFEDIFQMAKTSPEGMDTLIEKLDSLSLLFQPNTRTRQEEQENFIGCTIPDDVQVHPPNDIRSKGKCKRILGHADKKKGVNIQVHANAQHAKMLGMIGAIAQTKGADAAAQTCSLLPAAMNQCTYSISCSTFFHISSMLLNLRT